MAVLRMYCMGIVNILHPVYFQFPPRTGAGRCCAVVEYARARGLLCIGRNREATALVGAHFVRTHQLVASAFRSQAMDGYAPAAGRQRPTSMIVAVQYCIEKTFKI